MSVVGIMDRARCEMLPDQTVLDAVRLMGNLRVGAVPIVQKEALEGIFTYRDLIDRVLLEGRAIEKTPLGDVMTREVESIRRDASYGDALRLMVDRDFTYVPVVDERNCFLGMLSLRALLEHQVNDVSQHLDAVTQYFSVDAPGGD